MMSGQPENEMRKMKQEKKFRFFFLYLLFGYPVSSYVTSFIGIESNIISIVTRAIAVLLGISYLIFLIRQRLFKIGSWSFWLFLLFWMMYLPRLVHDTLLFGSVLGNPPGMYYLFGVVLSFLITIPLFAPVELNIEKFESTCFKIVVALNVIGFYNVLHSDLLFMGRGSGNEKLNPITTGFIAALLVVFSLRRIAFKKYKNILQFIGYIGCICLGLATMVITSTKSVFIFVGFIIFLFSIRLIRRLQLAAFFYIFLIIAFLFAVVVLSGMSNYFELILLRFQFTSSGEDRSSEERIMLLEGAFNQIAESPFLGSFLEEKTLHQYPHNVIVDSFMATGIFGGMIYSILYLNYIIQTLRLLFISEFNFFFLISFGFIILSILSGSLSFGPELWYFIAATSGYRYLQKQNRLIKQHTLTKQ